MPDIVTVGKSSASPAGVDVSVSVLISRRQPNAVNGLAVSLAPSADFVGSLRFQQDTGPDGNASKTDVAWTDRATTEAYSAGREVIGGQAQQPVSATTNVSATIADAVGDLYLTGIIRAGSVTAWTVLASPSVTLATAATTANLSGLTLDSIPITYPENLAFQFELAKDAAADNA